MMQQYARIKEQHRDAILFFRLGDFYEMFQRDAEQASRILGLTLTQRQGVPMCGVPHHASRGYIARLLKTGRKVAICEQKHVPANGKGIAEREVVEIITPGTVIDDDYLDRRESNCLLVVGSPDEASVVCAVGDVSTGTLTIELLASGDTAPALRGIIARTQPKEILAQQTVLESSSEVASVLSDLPVSVARIPDWNFDASIGFERLCRTLGTVNLKSHGIESGDPVLGSVAVFLSYAEETTGVPPVLLGGFRVMRSNTPVLDESTLRNLEVLRNMQDGSRSYSLLQTVDATETAMGARLLGAWLASPSVDTQQIVARHDAVEALYRSQTRLTGIRRELQSMSDIERLATRIALGRAHGKDLKAVAQSLRQVETLNELLGDPREALSETAADLLIPIPGEQARARLADLADTLESALVENPSTVENEGNLIRPDYDPELSDLHTIRDTGEQRMQEHLESEKAASGLSTLKLKYNRVIGHFFEVTPSQADRVPRHFRRRQSLANAERFTTDELTNLEQRMYDAEEKIINLERTIFLTLRSRAMSNAAELAGTAARVARIDVLASFAYTATVRAYTRPQITDTPLLSIREGRHPVVEAHVASGDFVPNDLDLHADRNRFILLTGPNMAGKSTYLRQTALIVLLAQTGSFVPAANATVGIADRIFCRVGAGDNLARGESTFLVEMNETAFILRQASKRSIIIMDEVGRGTGTVDGLSIAQSVCEYVVDRIRCRTLFATHYHELTTMKLDGIHNHRMAVNDRGGRIEFLKKVEEGATLQSYGIHVAELAGIPEEVIQRATELLAEHGARSADRTHPQQAEHSDRARSVQSLFQTEELVADMLRNTNIDETTPLDALLFLQKLKKILQSE
ncbi:MAG: DNA mismatch repair protein MutS [Spirochaetaceae bacterium]